MHISAADCICLGLDYFHYSNQKKVSLIGYIHHKYNEKNAKKLTLALNGGLIMQIEKEVLNSIANHRRMKKVLDFKSDKLKEHIKHLSAADLKEHIKDLIALKKPKNLSIGDYEALFDVIDIVLQDMESINHIPIEALKMRTELVHKFLLTSEKTRLYPTENQIDIMVEVFNGMLKDESKFIKPEELSDTYNKDDRVFITCAYTIYKQERELLLKLGDIFRKQSLNMQFRLIGHFESINSISDKAIAFVKAYMELDDKGKKEILKHSEKVSLETLSKNSSYYSIIYDLMFDYISDDEIKAFVQKNEKSFERTLFDTYFEMIKEKSNVSLESFPMIYLCYLEGLINKVSFYVEADNEKWNLIIAYSRMTDGKTNNKLLDKVANLSRQKKKAAGD